MANVRSLALRQRAIELAGTGLSDTDVGRRLGLPRGTVEYMRATSERPRWRCPRCWLGGRRIELNPADYAELLGLYLGDGCISAAGRTARLRLALDARYRQILTDAEAILKRGFPTSSVARVSADGGATVFLSVYSSHLACLFPQHRPGKKHERRILLEAWQRRLVAQEPWAFLRGCIRSDGCSFVNRTGPYEYLTYEFRNRSEDILRLFLDTCERLGLEYRIHSERVRINRRSSVAAFVEHVGVKA